MAENSNIQWTDHTLNFWWVCTKVHAGCTNCYAEAWDKRHGGKNWGKSAPRRMIKSAFENLAKWNAKAKSQGVVHRVFASSMCDVYEDHDGPVIDSKKEVISELRIAHLRDRFQLEAPTYANLEFLILTKRPENIMRMCPPVWRTGGRWPANVMTGTSPCNQETADESIPNLIKVPGRHFLSCEPLLGPVDLRKYLSTRRISWCICGGESGGKARAFNVDAARQIMYQCREFNVPYFCKQLGDNPTIDGTVPLTISARKGKEMSEWPEDLRVQEFPPLYTQL